MQSRINADVVYSVTVIGLRIYYINVNMERWRRRERWRLLFVYYSASLHATVTLEHTPDNKSLIGRDTDSDTSLVHPPLLITYNIKRSFNINKHPSKYVCGGGEGSIKLWLNYRRRWISSTASDTHIPSFIQSSGDPLSNHLTTTNQPMKPYQ